MKKFLIFLAAFAILLSALSICAAAEGELVDPSAFSLKDGRVYKGDVELGGPVDEVPPGTKGPIRYWSIIVPEDEGETGVCFFSGDGAGVTFVPLDSSFSFQTVTFSPDGDCFVLGTGSDVRPDVTFEVYNVGTGEKFAEFPGIRGDVQWIDPVRFVLTRIDDIRQGRYLNLGYGLRLSVVMYDVDAREATVLKEATDTQNYSLLSVKGDRSGISVMEESVKSEKDWENEDKIETRIIEIAIPAAG